MGQMERESAKRVKKDKLKKLILESVKVAGLATVLVVAPNVVGAMAKLGMIPSKRQKEIVRRSCDRLIDLGLLYRNDRGLLRLTPKGENALKVLEMKEHKLPRSRRWDRKWRILIFDIPEYRKGLREKIRRTLHSIGFARLQDSVWIYPHDCEDLVTLLKADFKVGKDILYIIADSLENDRALRKQFGLPLS